MQPTIIITLIRKYFIEHDNDSLHQHINISMEDIVVIMNTNLFHRD